MERKVTGKVPLVPNVLYESQALFEGWNPLYQINRANIIHQGTRGTNSDQSGDLLPLPDAAASRRETVRRQARSQTCPGDRVDAQALHHHSHLYTTPFVSFHEATLHPGDEESGTDQKVAVDLFNSVI